MTKFNISDGKRFCILCKKELIDLPSNVSIHPVPCQFELDNFVPQNIQTDFPLFFKQLTGFSLSPKQEQMFLLLEEKEENFIITDRQTGRSTFLLVYVIYKAVTSEVKHRYGIIYVNQNEELRGNKLMKEMLLRLTDEERDKLGITIYQSPYGRYHVRNHYELVDTFFPMEIKDFRQFDWEYAFTTFTKVITGYFPSFGGVFRRGIWNLYTDPIR